MNLIQSATQTMSSREIAELTGKNHFDVCRDINKTLSQAEIDVSKFAGIWTDSQNRKRTEYNLPKRECDLVISGYSVKYRLAIIDRWHELESKKTPALPQTFAEALQLAADQAKQLEEAKPKLEYHDKVLSTENGFTTTEIASELGLSAIKLNRALESMKIQRKIGRRWVLTAANLDKGLTVERTFVDDSETSRHSMAWTEQGRKFIHELMEGLS